MIFGLNLPNYSSLGHRDAMKFHGAHIDYSGVLFSPRPSAPLRIVVGGTSRAALRRAATLGDGWHGLYLSPEQVRLAPSANAATRTNSRYHCGRPRESELTP